MPVWLLIKYVPAFISVPLMLFSAAFKRSALINLTCMSNISAFWLQVVLSTKPLVKIEGIATMLLSVSAAILIIAE